MKKILFTLSLVILPQIFLSAQSIQLTKEDNLYFSQQLPRYERWLNRQGFGTLLEIYEIDPDTNMITLVLKSTISNADSTRWAWQKMKNNYASTHKDSLEAYLFRVFCKIMQVPEEIAVIEIYNDIGDEIPCFYRGIYWKEDELQTISRLCMNKQSLVIIEDFDLLPGIKISSTHLKDIPKKKLIRRNLKMEIHSFFQKYFVDERKARLNFLNDSSVLVFCEVTNIHQEILADETNPTLANILNWFGFDLTWFKQEMLTIRINYKYEQEHKIEVDINGKYGSGFHKPRRNAYIDMEPEFDEYVAMYADKLAEKIKIHLTNN